MLNKILYSITNRSTGYTNDIFTDIGVFAPSQPTPAETEVRDLLALSNTTTDFYVVGCLAAIDAFPEIKNEFKPEVETYKLKSYKPPSPRFLGGKLVSDRDGPPMLSVKADQFPVPTSIIITPLTDNTARVTHGKNVYEVDVNASRVNPLIQVKWPAELGVRGSLELTEVWSLASRVEIKYTPITFPYDLVVDAIKNSRGLVTLLRTHGVLENFFLSERSIEKVALACLALGKSNPAIYGH